MNYFSGYISRLQIYTGKDRENEEGEFGQGMRVVNDLIQPYENKGYHLYLDNFYTSPDLFKSLYEREVYACGTLRWGRRGFPKDIEINKSNSRRRDRGFSDWTMCGPILAQVWVDNKPVYFLSTIHRPEHDPDTKEDCKSVKRRGGNGGVDVPCPPLLHQYNTGMGGVDFNDRQRKYYNLGRRSYRWYRRIFFYLLEVTIHNSYILSKKVNKKCEPLDFRLNLVTQLIGDTRADRNVGRPRSIDVPRLDKVGIHLPMILESSLVCKVCSRVSSENYKKKYKDVPKNIRPKMPYISRSQIVCEECQVALCLSQNRNCFKVWHSKVEYWRQ